jgi:hypothetical protein
VGPLETFTLEVLSSPTFGEDILQRDNDDRDPQKVVSNPLFDERSIYIKFFPISLHLSKLLKISDLFASLLLLSISEIKLNLESWDLRDLLFAEFSIKFRVQMIK